MTKHLAVWCVCASVCVLMGCGSSSTDRLRRERKQWFEGLVSDAREELTKRYTLPLWWRTPVSPHRQTRWLRRPEELKRQPVHRRRFSRRRRRSLSRRALRISGRAKGASRRARR